MKYKLNTNEELSVVVHTQNTNTRESETGELLQVRGQPELYSE